MSICMYNSVHNIYMCMQNYIYIYIYRNLPMGKGDGKTVQQPSYVILIVD